MQIIYPSLPAGHDLSGIRIGGNGMGNCFFAYFHAVVMAQEVKGRLIAPTWWSVKIGPLLRREVTLRRYGTMFRPHPDEISGLHKALRLMRFWSSRRRVYVPVTNLPENCHKLTVVEIPPGGDNVYGFTFVGLQAHREMIRRRLLDIIITPPAEMPQWGASAYAAAHIRLGDFIKVPGDQLKRDRVNPLLRPDQRNKPQATDGLRIPLVWYGNVIRRVRTLYPDLPVYIFSDGREEELSEILTIEGVSLRREGSDVADLLKLAQARLLIGSFSTFSRWATFLGNMPSIWLKTDIEMEPPSSATTPILFIEEDVENITHEAISR
jgi:hypothetical protein